MKYFQNFLINEQKALKKLTKLYGEGDYSSHINKYKKDNLKLVIICSIILSLILISLLTEAEESPFIIENKTVYLNTKDITKKDLITINLTMEREDQRRNVTVTSKNPNERATDYLIERSENESAFEEAERQIRFLLKTVWETEGREKIALPDLSENGVHYLWAVKENNNYILIFPLALILLLFLFANRDKKLTRLEKDSMESVALNLSGFVTRLCLLLEAGLTVNTAIIKIGKDNELTCTKDEYFNEEIQKVLENYEKTKKDIVKGLREFSFRTNDAHFIRITGIIDENRLKGTELKEKLLLENHMLWEMKKKQGLERGKVAETKLVIPLMIQLLVLLIITIGPVFLSM
ncbi:MAG: hypothetical protein WCY49_04255 [Anaerovoracaceae bacterium]|nr:hypothetical protein [Clostridiales bacterium]